MKIAKRITGILAILAALDLLIMGIAAGLKGTSMREAHSIGIIGGADGPTAVFVAAKLSPHAALKAALLIGLVVGWLVLYIACKRNKK